MRHSFPEIFALRIEKGEVSSRLGGVAKLWLACTGTEDTTFSPRWPVTGGGLFRPPVLAAGPPSVTVLHGASISSVNRL
jgi:hypothetical protein